MQTGLEGKVVLITGAGRNIGKATAEMFAEEGTRLVLTTRRSQNLLDEVATICQAKGAEVTTALCDVADEDQVNTMVETATKAYGGVDVLINNAASWICKDPLGTIASVFTWQPVVRNWWNFWNRGHNI